MGSIAGTLYQYESAVRNGAVAVRQVIDTQKKASEFPRIGSIIGSGKGSD
jgi:hypothetical protein